LTILEPFMLRAALAGVGVAVAAAPLGSFVVWRRMAYFGDATAHAALLGVALALAVEMPVMVAVLIVALVTAFAVAALEGRSLAADTMLGVVAHSALALGLVAASFLTGVRIDLVAWLFGEILAVTRGDLAVIWGGAVLVVGLMWWRWSALLTATLSPDLAHAAGIDPRRERIVLTLALAVVVAVAIKVVGALLIGAMLVIPPAAARAFSATPERMAVLAGVIGAVSVLGGLELAFVLDTPAAPTMVCVAAGLFLLSQAAAPLGRAIRRG